MENVNNTEIPNNNYTENIKTKKSNLAVIVISLLSIIIIFLIVLVVELYIQVHKNNIKPYSVKTTSKSVVHKKTLKININPNIQGSWLSANSLPQGVQNATSIEYNGYIYEIGGSHELSGVSSNSVYYSHINTNGTIGQWNSTTSLPSPISEATSVEYDGFIYEMGGSTIGTTEGVDLSSVYYAVINSNGTIGQWNSTTSLPATLTQATSVEYNGFIYEIGGCQSACPISSVYYAIINSNGTIGQWNSTTSLPIPINTSTSVEYNGYIYEIGGYSNSRTSISSVYYSKINTNGTIGQWNSATSLLQSTFAISAVEYAGYIYEIGGDTSTNSSGLSPTNIYYSKINSNGNLSSWQSTTTVPLKTAAYGDNVLVYNGYIYQIGGYIPSSNTPSSNVYYAKL